MLDKKNATANGRVVRPKEAAIKLGVSKATLWRYASRPDFPQKIKMQGTVGWLDIDLNQWVASKRSGIEQCQNGIHHTS